MTEKERVLAVLEGKIPDKVPHFELDFQLFQEAFGVDMPYTYGRGPEEADEIRDVFLEGWERVMEKYHWAAIPVNCNYLIADAKRRFGDRAAVFCYNGDGTFWMPSGDKIMDFVIDLYEHPEDLHQQAKKKCRDAIELAKMQADAGTDFICLNSDFGFNDGPFISPTMFAEFVTPYLTEIVGAIHDLGLKAILHSDGDRLILMGNVKSAALQDSDPETIRESVRYAIENGKPGGKYIFSTSNCIFAGMPLENYHIMLDEYEKLAYYH